MSRFVIFVYGVLSYFVFFASFLYAIGFVGNIWVPKSIDSAAEGPLMQSLLINALLLGIFAIQHSVMARPAFKRWWTKIIPQAAERSTYVLLSSLALFLMYAYWQPIGGEIWNVSDATGRNLLYALYAIGWGTVLVSTFLINHFDLFGLRQVWYHLRGQECPPLSFVTPGPYRYCRHPIYLGFIVAFWATPTMTAAHLFFAIMTTVYILIGLRLEELDLKTYHEDYNDYSKQVPMLVPRLGGAYKADH